MARGGFRPAKTEPVELDDRFWSKVEKSEDPDGCWIWTSAVTGKGYGVFSVKLDGKWTTRSPHRLVYLALVGPIPPKFTVDHLCGVKNCCNPAHLEAVSRGENTLRGDGPTARNARKTHCKRGHPFDEENTRIRKNGGRGCWACQRLYDAGEEVA